MIERRVVAVRLVLDELIDRCDGSDPSTSFEK